MRLGYFEDMLGGKTMANARERLKYADKRVKEAKNAPNLAQQAEMKGEYNKAMLRRGASIGVAAGVPAYGGYRYANRRNRSMGGY